VFEAEMGIGGWDSEDWNKIPVTDIGKKWSVLKDWNEGLRLIRGQKDEQCGEGRKLVSNRIWNFARR
jgi:hypothetical protein